jgi:hypothetical protein
MTKKIACELFIVEIRKQEFLYHVDDLSNDLIILPIY